MKFYIILFCLFMQQTLMAQQDSSLTYIPIERDPKLLNLNELKNEIVYPETLKTQEIEGSVIVTVLVSEEGKYMRHFIRYSSDTLFTLAVEKILPRLSFLPGISNKKPVKCWVTVPFSFGTFKKIENIAYQWSFQPLAQYTEKLEQQYGEKHVVVYKDTQQKSIMGYSFEVYSYTSETELLLGIGHNTLNNNFIVLERGSNRTLIQVTGDWNGYILTEKREGYWFTFFKESKKHSTEDLAYLKEVKLVPIQSKQK